jgi:hypothetical protein
MPKTGGVPVSDVPICPDCRGTLSFVGSWTCRGLWGYDEVRTYECPEHGPIFVGPHTSDGHSPSKRQDVGPDEGDRDSLIWAPRKPMPTLDADSIAIPEPDSN